MLKIVMHENNLKEYFLKQLKKKTLEDLSLSRVSYNNLDNILRSDKRYCLRSNQARKICLL